MRLSTRTANTTPIFPRVYAFLTCARVSAANEQVENVGEIDCHKSVFFANIKIFLEWNEPELAKCTDEEIRQLTQAPGWQGMTASHSCPLWGRLQFFHPDLQVLNLHTHLRCSSDMRVKDKAHGRVKMSMYICDWLEMDVGGALRNFPFDYHDLHVSLRSHKLDTSKLHLTAWPGMHTAEFQEQQNEWQLAGHRGDLVETDPSTSSTGKTYHEFHVVVMVRRYYSWYIWNVGVYMMALFSMSMAMYMMPISALGDRAESSVALILAIIATKFVVADHIPRCRYVTFFDSYVLACFAFNTFAGAESIVVYKIGLTHPELADTINDMCSFIIPTLYLLFHLYLYCRFKQHFRLHDIWMMQSMTGEDSECGFEMKSKSMKSLNKQELTYLAESVSFRGKKALTSQQAAISQQQYRKDSTIFMGAPSTGFIAASYNNRLTRVVKVSPADATEEGGAPGSGGTMSKKRIPLVSGSASEIEQGIETITMQ